MVDRSLNDVRLVLVCFQTCFAVLVFRPFVFDAHDFWRTNLPRRVAGATDTLSLVRDGGLVLFADALFW